MCNASSRITPNAAGWNMAFCGCAASRVTSSTWLPSAANAAASRKVFTLQTLPACEPEDQFSDTVGKVAGFSLHAGVAAEAQERQKLERLCRYISRPAISEKRLSLTSGGNVRYQLKTPYREGFPSERSECSGHGTKHVMFEPLDFIARLAALVPRPRVNLTRNSSASAFSIASTNRKKTGNSGRQSL